MKRLLLAIVFLCGVAYGQTETVSSNFPKPEGRGSLKVYTCADPAAGQENSCTVPAGKIWRLVGLQLTLVTDATVANRVPTLTFDDGTTELLRVEAPTAATASTTRKYSVAAWPLAGGTAGTSTQVPLFDGVLLGPGYRIRTITAAIAGGDNYGAPVVYVEEWNK